MFNPQLLVDYLNESLEDPVQLSPETLPNPALTVGTVYYVGHIKIEPLSDIGELLDETEVSLGAAEYILFTNIYIICPAAEVHEKWKALKELMIKYNPYGEDGNWGRYTHSGGDNLALHNGRMVWADLWRIKFPAI